MQKKLPIDHVVPFNVSRLACKETELGLLETQ